MPVEVGTGLASQIVLLRMSLDSIVKLTTGVRTIENLAVVRYSAKRDGATGNALAVVFEFKTDAGASLYLSQLGFVEAET